MEKKKIFDILYVVLIVAVVLTCVFVCYYYYSNGAKCVQDPLKYENEKMKAVNYQCYCLSLTDPYGMFHYKANGN